MKTCEINIGDIVTEQDHPESLLVVVETVPGVQTFKIAVTEDEHWKLEVGGSPSSPLRKMGSLSLEAVAEGVTRTFGRGAGDEFYDKELNRLEQQASKGGVDSPCF